MKYFLLFDDSALYSFQGNEVGYTDAFLGGAWRDGQMTFETRADLVRKGQLREVGKQEVNRFIKIWKKAA